jgi:hypothetical protein
LSSITSVFSAGAAHAARILAGVTVITAHLHARLHPSSWMSAITAVRAAVCEGRSSEGARRHKGRGTNDGWKIVPDERKT